VSFSLKAYTSCSSRLITPGIWTTDRTGK
jgi:hypothetical protein